ncbi:MAG: hypothetical protein ACFB0F_04035 [Neomegalonema sp.]
MTDPISDEAQKFQEKSSAGKTWTLGRWIWWLTSRGAVFASIATLLDTASTYLWFASGATFGGIAWGLIGLWSLRSANRVRAESGQKALAFLLLAAAAFGVGWLHWTETVDWGGFLREQIETYRGIDE